MLALDEEVDYLEYQRYLRSQTDIDLFDILAHLDPEHCPRRVEAAQRELSRRHVPLCARYKDSDTIWRKFLMLVIAILALTLLLGLAMSRDEAIAPQPLPSFDIQTSGDVLQISGSPLAGGDQMSATIVGVFFGQLAENLLRSAVLFASRSGIYLALFGITLWKLAAGKRDWLHADPLTEDIRKLLVISLAAELILLAAAGCNNLPVLVTGGHDIPSGFFARAITVLAPWLSA